MASYQIGRAYWRAFVNYCSVLALGVSSSALAASQLAEVREDCALIDEQGISIESTGGFIPQLAGGSSALQGGSELPLLWTHESNGQWIAENISLGDGSAFAHVEYGGFVRTDALFSRHDSSPATVIWSQQESEVNFFRQVASAENSNLSVSLRQRPFASSAAEREVLLAAYDSSSPQPIWEFSLAVLLPSYTVADVAVSSDGSRIFAYAYLAPASSIYAVTVGTEVDASGTRQFAVLAEGLIQTLGPPKAFVVSDDGTTAVFGSNLKLTCVDVLTATETQGILHPGSPQYGGVAISADGNRLAFGTIGAVRIYDRSTAGAFSLASSISFGSDEYVLSAGLDAAGNTLALGMHRFGDYSTSLLRTLDANTGELFADKSYSSASSLQNLVRKVDVSSDGSCVAFGAWGDELGGVPEVVVLNAITGDVLIEYDLPGSVLDIDLSEDGEWLAVASKGVHANTSGGGGAFSLFQVRHPALRVQGTPRIGSTIAVEYRVRSGSLARLVQALTLSATPVQDPIVDGLSLTGLLHLELAGLALHEPGSSNAEHVFTTSVTIPDDPALIGSELYFQAVNLSDAELSATFSRIRVLPH